MKDECFTFGWPDAFAVVGTTLLMVVLVLGIMYLLGDRR